LLQFGLLEPYLLVRRSLVAQDRVHHLGHRLVGSQRRLGCGHVNRRQVGSGRAVLVEPLEHAQEAAERILGIRNLQADLLGGVMRLVGEQTDQVQVSCHLPREEPLPGRLFDAVKEVVAGRPPADRGIQSRGEAQPEPHHDVEDPFGIADVAESAEQLLHFDTQGFVHLGDEGGDFVIQGHRGAGDHGASTLSASRQGACGDIVCTLACWQGQAVPALPRAA
jgi:hypothetical protein